MNMDELLFGKQADRHDELGELRAELMKSNDILLRYIDNDREAKREMARKIEELEKTLAAVLHMVEYHEEKVREI